MKRLAVWLISIYQKVSFAFPSHCIYTPTCSCYAKEAFLKYPFLKALKVSVARILRCHPLAKGGFDPVNPVREDDCLTGCPGSSNRGKAAQGS